MKKSFALIILFVNLIAELYAQITLPAFFSDKMVLQQQSEISVWGKASPNKKLTISASWIKTEYTVVVNNDSTWKLKIQTPEASYGHHTLVIKQGKLAKSIKEVLIGEVWLCSGQSNMEMPMQGASNQPVLGGLEAIMLSTNDAVRCFTVKKDYSLKPRQDVTGEWQSASPLTTPTFTATGYYFARLLEQVLRVPVGIINSSYGGSWIEAWMPKEAAFLFGLKNEVDKESEIVEPKKEPSVMHNAMLAPLVGYNIKGVLWYQGESNRKDYKQYPAYFAEMHKDWQQRWGIGKFPIYFVQLAPYDYGDGTGVLMREAQEKISQTQSGTGMAVLTDIGEEKIIHPSNKKLVGERLAYLALGKTYFPMNEKFNINYFFFQSPVYRYMEMKDNVAILYFKYVTRGFSSFGASTDGLFEIAGEDRVFYPATIKLVNQTNAIQVSAPEVRNPVAVRYAFKDYVKGTVYSAQGFPLSSFRTDQWE